MKDAGSDDRWNNRKEETCLNLACVIYEAANHNIP
jgi:hypothetical protein